MTDLVQEMRDLADAPADHSGANVDHKINTALRKGVARIEALESMGIKKDQEISQTLGKVLGFPWYKDDQKNFPGATEADGICTGELFAEDLAHMAAVKIKRLESELEIATAMGKEAINQLALWREAGKPFVNAATQPGTTGKEHLIIIAVKPDDLRHIAALAEEGK